MFSLRATKSTRIQGRRSHWTWLSLSLAFGMVGGCAADGDESLGTKREKVIPGPDGGWVTECNGWEDGGPYNFCTWNCHNAATCGVQAGNDGVISCDGEGPSSASGHAVNWDTVPCAGDAGSKCVGYCISEPQLPGSAACCWEQTNGGAMNIASGPGLACANAICDRDGGEIAFDTGVTFDTRSCFDIYGATAACRQCCRDRANFSWCDDAAPCIADMQHFLDLCLMECDGDGGDSGRDASDARDASGTSDARDASDAESGTIIGTGGSGGSGGRDGGTGGSGGVVCVGAGSGPVACPVLPPGWNIVGFASMLLAATGLLRVRRRQQED